MCETLNFNQDVLAKRYYKGLTVEPFHRFLNNNVAIFAEKHSINHIFVSAGVTTRYAQNSAPIDGIDIFRSIPAIGRKFHCTSDISLNVLLKLTYNNGEAALYYL